MLSIGNDIVDLNFIDPERTGSIKFYSKILSKAEQDQYQRLPTDTISFVNYVWMLWSAKEAVYKLQKRHQSGLIFSPTTLELEFLEFSQEQNATSGIRSWYKFVHYADTDEILCQTIITQNFIHTVAASSFNADDVLIDVQQIDTTEYLHQSAAVRSLLARKLVEMMPGANISFSKKPAGYPVILNDGLDTGLIASFAHHGNYVAYAIINCK
ncbi:4'-phosphopantetheinyl transferase family protein [Mucilaginibacter ginkgonis]|uniref:4-phosphopantetheinyl transferase family protein n=1 Tax=Mucilaginibacter ginkgonis TaxID=2682091 RepID=A0A6I4HZD1_9SPHI|nr:4'-phosphopantetheinyl transferase superfamily protein [Mucilaginibacter ginkgonis]QQL49461.1 4-phosphopantetheinyl transferase family protein [Mucilaginibacter ginkgonis]